MAKDKSVIRHIMLVSFVFVGLVAYVAWRMGSTEPSDATPDIPDNGLATATEANTLTDEPIIPAPPTITDVTPDEATTIEDRPASDSPVKIPDMTTDEGNLASAIGGNAASGEPKENAGLELSIPDETPASSALTTTEPESAGTAAMREPSIKIESTDFSYHTVKSGETLSSISRQYYGTPSEWKKIQEANSALITDAAKMKAGITIKIPGVASSSSSTIENKASSESSIQHPSSYVIQKGDTLSHISMMMYGNKSGWKTIHRANTDKIPNPNNLTVGVTIAIPDYNKE
ncbi:MAG: LysM peptidoglycan-binding domain-containing protein [Planctomycetes bacterium]|nr:LysM peptidoglycan-binding domain-containing protein [Planctomycetota bacterium]